MKLLIDSADQKEIYFWSEFPFIKGVTTNPTLLLRNGEDRLVTMHSIYQKTHEKVFVQVIGETEEAMYKDYQELLAYADNYGIDFVVKIPVDKEGLKTIKRVKDNHLNQEVLGTAIYSFEQCIMAVLSGCDYIAPYYNRMININEDPNRVIKLIRNYIDQIDSKCIIVAASFKDKTQVVKALEHGAHTCTISPQVLKSLISNETVNQAIDQFNKDGKLLEDKVNRSV